MSAGLFVLSCPDCGTELEVDHLGAGSCGNCGHSFLSRFGHLIPVDSPVDLPVDLPVDPTGRRESPVLSIED